MTRARDRLVGLAIALLCVLPSFVWIALDRRVWPYDQAWYGEVSAQLWGSIFLAPQNWYIEMMTLMPAKPPLLPWVGQAFMPLGLWIGDVDFALLSLVVLCQAAALWCVYLLVRGLVAGSAWWAVAATIMAGSAPLFVGMNHQYLVEGPQTLVIAASFLLALRSVTMPPMRTLALLALLVAAGAAVKTTTPLYCGLAWLIAAANAVLVWRRTRSIRLDSWFWLALAATVVVGILGLLWYARNVLPMLAHLRDATSSEIASQYGSVGALGPKLVFWWQAMAAGTFMLPATIYPAAAALVAGLAWGAYRLFTRRLRLDTGAIVVLAAVAHVAITLLVLALQINEETRFLEPATPLLVIGAVVAVAQILRHRAAAILLAALSLAQSGAAYAEAFGVVPKISQAVWLLPLHPDVGDRSTIAALARATCPQSDAYRYVIIGVQYSELNDNSTAMYSARDRVTSGWRCNYTSLGYAETDVDRALKRVDDLDASFIILPVEDRLPKDPNFLNMIVGAVYQRVSTGNRFSREGAPINGYQVWHRLGD